MHPAVKVPFPMEGNNRFTNNGLMNSQVASFIPNACRRCHHGGCDVKVQDCGCLFHAVSAFDDRAKSYILNLMVFIVCILNLYFIDYFLSISLYRPPLSHV